MLSIKNPLLAKGMFAVAVVAVAGIVGGVNFVNAQSVNGASASKPTKEQCAAAGYKNYGQCVRVWAQDKSGYGRVSTVNTVGVTVNNAQSATTGNVTATNARNVSGGNASVSSSTNVNVSAHN